MSLTNICSCALTKDHKMRQITNDLYQLFIRIINLASFLLAPLAEWQQSFYNAFFGVQLSQEGTDVL